MTDLQCEYSGCSKPAYTKVDFLDKYVCLKHYQGLGDFDRNGRVKN